MEFISCVNHLRYAYIYIYHILQSIEQHGHIYSHRMCQCVRYQHTTSVFLCAIVTIYSINMCDSVVTLYIYIQIRQQSLHTSHTLVNIPERDVLGETSQMCHHIHRLYVQPYRCVLVPSQRQARICFSCISYQYGYASIVSYHYGYINVISVYTYTLCAITQQCQHYTSEICSSANPFDDPTMLIFIC